MNNTPIETTTMYTPIQRLNSPVTSSNVKEDVTYPKGGISVTAYVEPTVKNKGVDINKLAKAVARHETGNCKLGYGKEYNNCFGIKNGGTAPCKKMGRNNMCIYNSPAESYDAFNIIRSKWYKTLPTLALAKKWSGNDRASEWLKNVLFFYNQ